ncbi:class I tRNA ligase family protein [Niallia taxi]|uniref:class I tRNA ligase family protein n=1 Tax=Niallia taxi TaxID=2499688 RepID=UPI00203FAD9B|nr:class I tRNA ligase family protein [Niallia taxi]MCM3216677.1 class I tRNA ligase family protein [Niallia taxi]
MIKITKYDQSKATHEYDILCQRLYPLNDDIYTSPFGGMLATVKPLKTSKPHDHHEVESFIIFKGKGLITIGDEQSEVVQGDVIYIPPFTNHSLLNLSSTEDLIYYTSWWENEKSITKNKEMEKYFITATPPTPNGDLHVGHLSGPFTGADILKRYLNASGREAYYITGADDHQSYVPFKGEQQNKSSREVADYYGEEIKKTLSMAKIEPDLYLKPKFSNRHNEFVQQFFLKLWEKSCLIEKEVDAFYCENCEKFLFEAHIKGNCPHCKSESDGNACEKCGRPNLCTDLEHAHCKSCSSTPIRKKIKQLFFPLSNYEKELKEYYKQLNTGPHLRSLFQNMMNDGLPDIPVTHISDWGIPVPVEGYEEQTIYVWFEMAPGYLSATYDLIDQKNLGLTFDGIWKDNQTQIINFFGFDNGYFHSVLFPALYLAYDKEINLPKTMITNEFYNLDGLKFSTSRNHAIWGKELLDSYNPDLVRYYLSLTRPEIEQTNFGINRFKDTVEQEILLKWNGWLKDLSAKISSIKGLNKFDKIELNPYQQSFLARIKELYKITCNSYEPASFSPQRAVKTINDLVSEVVKFSKAEALYELNSLNIEEKVSSLLLELTVAKALSALSYPIMPSFSQQLWNDLGYKGALKIENNLLMESTINNKEINNDGYFLLEVEKLEV